MNSPLMAGRATTGLTIEPYSADRAEDVAGLFNAATATLPYCGTLTAATVRDRLCAPSFFDPAALLIAYRAGRPLAYAHGAFGAPTAGTVEPRRRVGNIRGLFFSPAEVDAGRVVLDELITYLTGQGAEDL